jgi:hypothetical protein
LETWVSSDAVVIRWLPTIAAEPNFTGVVEHAASSKQAPRPTVPRAATRRPRLVPNTGNPFQDINDRESYDSDSTERMTSAHHASNSVSRSGSPPKPPLEAPAFGTGTSMVRTAGLRIVFGYSR